MNTCSSCGSTHMGPVPCGLSFAGRMRSVTVDPSVLESRTRRNYYDRSLAADVFGADAREQMLEETRGLGPIRTAADGSEWVNHDPATGELRPLETSDIVGGYLQGERREDDDDV